MESRVESTFQSIRKIIFAEVLLIVTGVLLIQYFFGLLFIVVGLYFLNDTVWWIDKNLNKEFKL